MGRMTHSAMPGSPGTPGSPPSPGAGTTGLDVFFERLRRLGVARTTEGRLGGGVCAGLARRWGVAPIVVRIGFLALAVVGGIGLLTYLVVLALLPDERGVILAEQAVRRGDGSAIFLLIIIGLLLAGEISDRWWVWAAIPLAVAAWWVVRGAAAGKTPAQLGREAHHGATGMARTVRSWGRPDELAPPSPAPHELPAPASPWPPMPPPEGTAEPTWGPSPWAGLPQDRPNPAPPTGMPPTPTPAPAPALAPEPTPAPAPALAPPPIATQPVALAAPHGMGPGRTWSPGVGATAPTVRARRRRGGFPIFVLAIGLGVTTFGLLGSYEPLFSRVDHPWAFAVIAGCAAAALVLIGAALRGLRASFTAFVVTAALVIGSVAAFVPAPFSIGDGVGERVWRPSPAAGGSAAYALSLGSARLDLSQVTTEANAYPVKVSLGVGEFVVDVPDGVVVRVELALGTGEVSAETHRGEKTAVLVGTGGGLVYRVGTGEPDVVVKASVGAGTVVLRSNTVPTFGEGADS